MKHLNQKLLTVLLFTVLITSNIYCQVYNFPVKPGTNEWRQFQTHDEMIRHCQIPDSIISSMSTKDLLESYLNYPLIMDMFAYDNLKDGFDKTNNTLNCFQILLKREDIGKIIIEKYKVMKVVIDINDTISAKVGDYTFKFSTIELFLSKDEILKKLNQSDKLVLLKDAMLKQEAKILHKNIHGSIGQLTNLYLTAKIMDYMGNSEWDLYVRNNNDVKNFIENMHMFRPELLEVIKLKTKEIIK